MSQQCHINNRAFECDGENMPMAMLQYDCLFFFPSVTTIDIAFEQLGA